MSCPSCGVAHNVLLRDSMGRRSHYPWEGHICSENVRNYNYARRQLELLPKDEQWKRRGLPY